MQRIIRWWVACGLLVLLGVGSFGTPYMVWGTLSYFVMVLGYLFRFHKKLHVRLMLSAMVADLALVLLLEIERHAVEKALEFSMSPLQQGHIFFSFLATLLYFPVVVLGWKRYRAPSPLWMRTWHIRLGKAAFFCRTMGVILMLSLIKR